MNTITHKQARDMIDLRLDGMLQPHQATLLEEHLRSCDSCRTYASEMDAVPIRLTHEFQTRWDNDPGPSARLMQHVISQARNFPAANRFSSGVGWLSGAVALLLLGLAVNVVVSRLQSTFAASADATASAPVDLSIDPQTCKPAAERSVPNELYGYDVIQNTSLVEGDFSFDFWLYCDPSLKVSDQEHYSAISGLGIYSSWRYNGPRVDGPVEYYYGFGQNEWLGRSSINGPLNKSSAAGNLGIYMSEDIILGYIQQGHAIKFRVTVNSSLGQNSAILSFHLEPTQRGLKVVDLQAYGPESLNGTLVAFVSSQNGNSEIYTMHTDGRGLTNITNSPARDVNPFWSPDGKHIAFESDRNGIPRIYLMNADGSSPVPLSNDDLGQSLPLNIDGRSNPWSPDGTKLLYLQQDPQEKESSLLYSIDINSKAKILLARGRVQSSNLSWSPTGEFVGYVLNHSASPDQTFLPGIHIVKADGALRFATTELLPPREVLNYPFYYWSRNGQSIFFTAYKHIDEGQDQWIAYEANIPKHTLIEKASSSTQMQDWWDGTSFILGNGGGSPLTWLRSDKTYSTLKPLENCEIADPTAELHYGIFPKRASNGDQILAITCPNNNLLFYYINFDGTNIKQLFKFPAPSGTESGIANILWSPDSKFIAFKINSPEGNRMYFLDVSEALHKSSVQPLQIHLDESSMIYEPSWQPTP